MTGVSSAMTKAFIVMGFAGMGWDAFTDKYGPRPAVLAGGVLLVCSAWSCLASAPVSSPSS